MSLLTVCRWNNRPPKTSIGLYFKSFLASTIQHFLLLSIDQLHGPSVDLHSVDDLCSSIISGFFETGTGLLSVTKNGFPWWSVSWLTDRRSILSPSLGQISLIWFQLLGPSVKDHHIQTITGKQIFECSVGNHFCRFQHSLQRFRSLQLPANTDKNTLKLLQ